MDALCARKVAGIRQRELVSASNHSSGLLQDVWESLNRWNPVAPPRHLGSKDAAGPPNDSARLRVEHAAAEDGAGTPPRSVDEAGGG